MHQHSFGIKDWPFNLSDSALAVTSKYVMNGERPILTVIHDDEDDWQLLCDTTNDPEDHMLICMGCIFEKFPFIAQFKDLPKSYEAYRKSEKRAWKRAEF